MVLRWQAERTSNFECPRLRSSNDPHPCYGQNTHSDDCGRTNNQRETKQNPRQEQVIQVEEGGIVTQSFQQERRSTFHVEGTIFSDSKEDSQGTQMFSLEHTAHIFLGGVGNGRRSTCNGFISAACVPFLLAEIATSRPTRWPIINTRQWVRDTSEKCSVQNGYPLNDHPSTALLTTTVTRIQSCFYSRWIDQSNNGRHGSSRCGCCLTRHGESIGSCSLYRHVRHGYHTAVCLLLWTKQWTQTGVKADSFFTAVAQGKNYPK